MSNKNSFIHPLLTIKGFKLLAQTLLFVCKCKDVPVFFFLLLLKMNDSLAQNHTYNGSAHQSCKGTTQ